VTITSNPSWPVDAGMRLSWIVGIYGRSLPRIIDEAMGADLKIRFLCLREVNS